jgi:hypothetical protein
VRGEGLKPGRFLPFNFLALTPYGVNGLFVFFNNAEEVNLIALLEM